MDDPRFHKKCRRTGHHKWGIPRKHYIETKTSRVRICIRPTCEGTKGVGDQATDTKEDPTAIFTGNVIGDWGEPIPYEEVNA